MWNNNMSLSATQCDGVTGPMVSLEQEDLLNSLP